MTTQTQASHLLVGYFYPLGVFPGDDGRLCLQTRFRLRATNVAQHDLERTQWLACPVDADVTEQPVFDGIPFRRSSRIVTNRDLEPVTIRQFLQSELPQSGPATVAASAISQNQEFVGLPIAVTPRCLPPSRNRVDGKLGCVGRQAHINAAPVLVWQVKPIWGRPARSFLKKVMTIHLVRFQTPGLPGVFKVADQLFFLGVHADHRPAGLQKPLLLSGDVAKLPISIRMRRTGDSFPAGLERELPFAKQTPNSHRINRVALRTQQSAQAFQAETHPLLLRHGIAAGLLFDQGQQVCLNFRTFFSTGGRPAPGRRVRPFGRSFKERFNSRRPRRIVRTFMPVIKDKSRSPPCPRRFDSNATYQRRCCSSRRPRSKFICRCSSILGCSSSRKQSGH